MQVLTAIGLFHEGHRAVEDCRALLEILGFQAPGSDETMLSKLLTKARQTQLRIWADQSPYELRSVLKQRGYRWSSVVEGRLRLHSADVEKIRLFAHY